MAEYLYRNPPPTIGCQPPGWKWREAWMLGKIHPSGGEGRFFLGTVTYPEPLPLEEVKRYELWPVDEVERAEYVFWLEGGDGGWLRESYLAQPVRELEKFAARGDPEVAQMARAALILKQAGRG